MDVADDNAGIIRRCYQALNAADVEALIRLFDEKATWHTPGRSHIAGDFYGRDRVIAQLARYVGETRGAFRIAIQDVFTSDDGRAIGVYLCSAERDGKRLDLGCCAALHLRNGRIISGREHFFNLYAWDAFWS